MSSGVNPKIAGDRQGWQLIEDRTLTADTSTITFDNLSGDLYTMFRLEYVGEVGTLPRVTGVRLNNDSTSGRYGTLNQSFATGGLTTTEEATDTTAYWLGTSATAISTGVVVNVQLDISCASGYLPDHVLCSRMSGSDKLMNLSTGQYTEADEITRIDLICKTFTTATYKTGSRFILSGMASK